MRGWCPVDDRVFDATDGRCPECGEELVAATTARGSSRGEWLRIGGEPDAIEPQSSGGSRQPSRVRIHPAVVGVVVVVFIAGMITGRAIGKRGDRASVRPSVAPKIVRALGPFPVVSHDGLGLRLARLSQDGTGVSASFDSFVVPGGTILAMEIQALAGPRPVDAQSTSDGRTVSANFELDNPSVPLKRITVSDITIAFPDRAVWNLPTKGMSLVGPVQPRVIRVEKEIRMRIGRVVLNAVVVWRDRIEVAFDLSDVRRVITPATYGSVEVVGHSPRDPDVPVDLIGVLDSNTDSYGVVLPASAPEAGTTLTITMSGFTKDIAGDWSWDVPAPVTR